MSSYVVSCKRLLLRHRRLLSLTFLGGLLFVGWLLSPSVHRFHPWYPVKPDALEDPCLLTIYCNPGRLGNQMSTYASLLGVSKLNNRTPYAQHCNTVHLRPYFHLTASEIYRIPAEEARDYPLAAYFRPEDGRIPKNKNVLSGYAFPNSFTFFDHIGDEIRREFRFREHITSYVGEVLRGLRKGRSSAVLVGVHVRRTDYCQFLRKNIGRQASLGYFRRAMDYFRTKYRDVLFVVVSDDRKWCRKHLAGWPDVLVAPHLPRPAYDMALLSHCHHNIITYGTFGFWAAYLAGGETVYLADYLSPNSSLLSRDKTYPPRWIGISADSWEFPSNDQSCDLAWYETLWDKFWYS